MIHDSAQTAEFNMCFTFISVSIQGCVRIPHVETSVRWESFECDGRNGRYENSIETRSYYY